MEDINPLIAPIRANFANFFYDWTKFADTAQREKMENLIYKEEVYAIVGAAMEVHRVLGRGFLEAVYQEAMALELTDRRIPYRAQVELEIQYKNHLLKKYYVADFVAFEKSL